MTEGRNGRGTKRPAIKRTPRPRDRKSQIVATARALFAHKGYAAVSAEEIASSVGITAGALYRHFDGKQDLLVHALIDALDAAASGVQRESAADLDGLVRALTDVSGANREIGLLWTREIRLLDDERRAVVRRHFFDVFRVVDHRLRQVRPDLGAGDVELLTWSVFAALTSVSYHAAPLTASTLDLLHALTVRLCSVALVSSAGEEPVADRHGILPQSRRELILTHAATLFHERGFAGTSLDDIGQLAGMSGAGIYRHFAAKADVLGELLARATAALQLQLVDSLARANDPADALARLVDDYIRFAVTHPALIGILLTEVRELPDADLARIRRAQREYLGEWEHLLRRLQPDLGTAEARTVVVAVLTVVNDATRTAQLRARPVLPENLGRIGRQMLRIAG